MLRLFLREAVFVLSHGMMKLPGKCINVNCKGKVKSGPWEDRESGNKVFTASANPLVPEAITSSKSCSVITANLHNTTQSEKMSWS